MALVPQALSQQAVTQKVAIVSISAGHRHHDAVARLIERDGLDATVIIDLEESVGPEAAVCMQEIAGLPTTSIEAMRAIVGSNDLL